MAKYLDPKADLTFKKVFGEHKNLVLSLLNSLLPMPAGMEIESVEYVSPEVHTGNLVRKHSIVDVKCLDNRGRYFFVEMQNYWTKSFFQRSLYNALSGYGSQLSRGESFSELKSVYALSLVNDRIAGLSVSDASYIHEYYLINKADHTDVHDDVGLVFVELPRFKPSNRAEDKLKDLWLKFLTEIDEDTVSVDSDLLSNPLTSQALTIVEEAAYTSVDMEAYRKYWLDISTERSAYEDFETRGIEKGMAKGMAKGLEQGRKEGLAEGLSKGRELGIREGIEQGRAQEKLEAARGLLKLGVLTPKQIAETLGLSEDDVKGLG